MKFAANAKSTEAAYRFERVGDGGGCGGFGSLSRRTLPHSLERLGPHQTSKNETGCREKILEITQTTLQPARKKSTTRAGVLSSGVFSSVCLLGWGSSAKLRHDFQSNNLGGGWNDAGEEGGAIHQSRRQVYPV